VAVFVVAATGGVALSAHVASGPLILQGGWGLLAELALWAALWAVGAAAALRLPLPLALPLILVAGIALRVAALAGPPVTSDDLYRYSWDGRAQVAGFDPYAHVPASPVLAPLRESWLWPDAAGCETIDRVPGCTRMNRPAAPTIYPPAAEAWFEAVYRVGGGVEARHKPWQVAGLVTEVAVLALLPLALRRFGRDPRWTALYAMSPAPVLEIVHNGHVDGLAILLVVAALVVAGGRWRFRDIAAGALIGLAALVKLFPIVLLLALAGLIGLVPEARRRASGPNRPNGRERVPELGLPKIRSLLRAGAAAAAVVALAYLPHVAAVGWKVLGYVPGYLHEERYADGGRFLLAGILGLSGTWAALVSMAACAVVAAWVLLRRPPVPAGGALILGALLLATSPVQPWYAVLLLAVATVAAQPRWSAVVVAGYPYYFAVVLDTGAAATIGRLAYAGALVVVVVVTLGRRSRTVHRETAKGGPLDRAHPPAGGAVPAEALGLH
jgi:hypothetical protein